MDFYHIAKEVIFEEGYSDIDFVGSTIMDILFGATVLMVGLVSVSSTFIELKLEQLMRILPERDHLKLTLV